MAIMNLVVVAYIFEAIYTKYIFTARYTNNSSLGSVSKSFDIIETNIWGIIYFHYFVWLWKAFYLSELCNWLFFSPHYIANMVKFNNNIICYLMADLLDYKKTSQKALSGNLNKINEEFALKLYKDINSVTSII